MVREPIDVDRAVVAITGGARGIGRATAEAFARRGARVVIGDIDSNLADQAASEIGRGVAALPVDVTDRNSVDAFVARIEQQVGPIDVYVNNAGIGPVAMINDETDALAERIFDINVHGTLFGMKAVLPGMLARGRGHIVNVASAAGKIAFPGAASYCASKHAVVALTESVRAELISSPVRLSLILPGIANTELASGVKRLRGIPIAEPEQIAADIVDAVAHDRFEVFIPRRLGAVSKLTAVIPRTLRERIMHALGIDTMLLDIDPDVRLAYHDRTIPKVQPHERASSVGTRTARTDA